MGKRKRVTLKTIADEVGVSVGLVSRVLSGEASQHRISKKTEEAVLEAADKLGFRPSELARGLRLRKTSIVGLAIPDISNRFFGRVARSVEIEARKLGYSVILYDTEYDEEKEKMGLSVLQGWMVAGVIIASISRAGDHLARLSQDGMPIVCIDGRYSDLDLPYVVSDNFMGSYQGTRHLLEHGHRCIAYVQGIPFHRTNVARVQGYKAALAEYGVPTKKAVVVGNSWDEKNGYVSAKRLLKREDRPTAVFLGNNLMALGALRAFAEERIGVPEDMSVVCFDDEPYAGHLATPMTTIAQHTAEMGRVAVKLLYKQIEEGRLGAAEGVSLPTELMSRESVGHVDGE